MKIKTTTRPNCVSIEVVEGFEINITGYDFKDKKVCHIDITSDVHLTKSGNTLNLTKIKPGFEDVFVERKETSAETALPIDHDLTKREREELLELISILPKYPYNAAVANHLLAKAIKIWQDGGGTPVGPSTPTSRFFEDFLQIHRNFPQMLTTK